MSDNKHTTVSFAQDGFSSAKTVFKQDKGLAMAKEVFKNPNSQLPDNKNQQPTQTSAKKNKK